ncbi:MAG: DNA primase [Candidatus Omnitrophota bacterium]
MEKAIGRIPENILDDILNKTDIVSLISSYIPLKRAGRNFRASCPFHHEKTPSFMVSSDKQIYHCFGCAAGGNAFNFLMQYDRLDFPEAVELLAEKAGIALPKKEEHKGGGFTTQLYKVNESAGLFYENILHSSLGLHSRQYLINRGIKQETAKLFKLGYAPDGWDNLMNNLRGKGINLSLIEKCGLILNKEDGGYYDRFRNRIIFPIFDLKSRILGFGARVMDASVPKYINSPETPVYIKGKNLYGLNLSKEDIARDDFAVVVEGYLDFMIPYQEGVRNIVASLGTALTPEQARLIRRYTSNVVMVYDSDTAGQMATIRSLDIFIDEGMNVKVASLPQGFDPDSFVRKSGVEDFKSRINAAENLFDYKLRVLKSSNSIKDAEGKARICSLMLPTINRFKNAILRSEYLKKLAQELKVNESALAEEIKKIKEDNTYLGINQDDKSKIGVHPTEKLLIKLMLEEEEFISRIKGELEPQDFQDERTARIVSLMFNLVSEGKVVEINSLVNSLSNDAASKVVCESMFLPEIPLQDKEKVVDDCIRRMKSKKAIIKRERLQAAIKTAQNSGDEVKLRSLMEEFHYLIKRGG